MNLVYIHQHFCTNEGSSGTRSLDVSRHLVKMGHKVTMICGIMDASGLAPLPWYRFYRRERMEGFDIIVCNARYSNSQGFKARLVNFLWFAVLASFAAMFKAPRPDLVFATHTPLTVSIPGWALSRWRRVPFAFEVRDLWPESDVIYGNLRPDSLVTKMISWLEVWSYKKADKVLLVSPGFEKRLIERGYLPDFLKTVLLGADGDIFRDLQENKSFRKEMGLEGKTIAVYTGVHGKANGLDYILDAAALTRDREDVVYLLVGNGMEKTRLLQRAKDECLDNVVFHDFVPKVELPGILATCDIGLMILYNVGERPVMPNKIFDYMFSGLPSIVNFPGPTLDMVTQDGTGVFADPTDPQELRDRVVYYADHKEEAKEIGTNARKLAYEKYDRESIARQLHETFEQMIRDRENGVKPVRRKEE